ncbi:hypothetical protein HY571_01685 [Candidatus Micrarchaeota archaeon]|nr:hypothetical protein [Candidatus Micrarchaeota archaeon]
MEYSEKIAVLGDADTVVGFSLAGVSEAVEVSSDNCESEFLKMAQRSDIGIIIVQDDLVQQGFTLKTRKNMESLARPVIVTVPGKSEALGGKKSGNIADLIKRAIGIELKT